MHRSAKDTPLFQRRQLQESGRLKIKTVENREFFALASHPVEKNELTPAYQAVGSFRIQPCIFG